MQGGVMKRIICSWLLIIALGFADSAGSEGMSMEELRADYQYWMGEAARQGIAYTSFDQWVQWRRMQEAGIDPQAVQRQQMQNQQEWFQGQQQIMKGQSAGHDAYNWGWYQEQGRSDAAMDRWSDGFRGQSDYYGESGETMKLPDGVNAGDTFSDGNNNYYFDGYDWYQTEPGGYGTQVYEVPYYR